MRKTLKRTILCLCLMTTMNGRAQDFILRQDSLLRVLDREIEHFDQHIARHQAQTRKLTQLLDKAETDSERYRWAYSLFQHYMAYASDSAFFYINPGVYYVRAFVDRNGNSIWDTGLYDDDLQPEEVYYYHRSIECKAKWDNTLQWNMTERKRYLQKPGELVKQKNSNNKKKQMNRNADRAKRLGIEYVKQNTIKVKNNESNNSKK